MDLFSLMELLMEKSQNVYPMIFDTAKNPKGYIIACIKEKIGWEKENNQ